MTRKVRKEYSASFKENAVKSVIEQNYTITEAAARLYPMDMKMHGFELC